MARDASATIEEFFWSHLCRFETGFGPSNKKMMNWLKKRLDVECKQYVALKLAEMLKQPTKPIYHGTSAELLAEVEKKYRAIRADEGEKLLQESKNKKWWQFWK